MIDIFLARRAGGPVEKLGSFRSKEDALLYSIAVVYKNESFWKDGDFVAWMDTDDEIFHLFSDEELGGGIAGHEA